MSVSSGEGCNDAARMVVDHDQLGRPLLERETEHLRGIHEAFLHGAEADQLDQQDLVAVGQADDPEMLLVAVDLVLAKQDALHDLVNID